MWLPASIYERVPQFYVLAGLLLIVDGFYIGAEMSYSYSYLYFVLGGGSILRGITLFLLRYVYRKDKKAEGQDEPDAVVSAEKKDFSEHGEVMARDLPPVQP